MNIDAGKLKESELKKKKLTEKEISENNKKIIEHQKLKEKISVEIDAENKLDNLKDLVSKGVLSKESAENVVKGIELDDETINEMFDKIEQIEDTKDVDKYLPKELRITKEDYKKATIDDIFRVQTITKLKSALTILGKQINPSSPLGVNLFTGFLCVLDKKLVLIQENTIDIKNNLEEIHENKFGKQIDRRTFFQKLIDFLK
ncbi:MAG: hypothetical protein PHS49_06035 [Candidatus Gracilibacteria bacterium]|nr:hypothetical protein [Candidatus Gracilibacteria bacterium]